MTDEKRYVPLSERLNQDVWHDNFVPKYSALASAEPSRLVLAGVWLIFAPMAVTSIVMGFPMVQDSPDLATAVITGFWALGAFVLAVANLYIQTRRYLHTQHNADTDSEE